MFFCGKHAFFASVIKPLSSFLALQEIRVRDSIEDECIKNLCKLQAVNICDNNTSVYVAARLGSALQEYSANGAFSVLDLSQLDACLNLKELAIFIERGTEENLLTWTTQLEKHRITWKFTRDEKAHKSPRSAVYDIIFAGFSTAEYYAIG